MVEPGVVAAAPFRFEPADLAPIGAIALVIGLWLLARGLIAYRTGTRVSTIATSPLTGLAAGEVRVSGTVEPAEVTLTSPLRSAPCVYYHARVTVQHDRSSSVEFDEERSVSFFLRDATGRVRVFPRGARWDLPDRIDASAGVGEVPIDVDANRGPAMELTGDREAQIARLLTVRGTPDPDASLFERTVVGGAGIGGPADGPTGFGLVGGSTALGSRRFVERRVDPGDVVTIVASAVPFGDLGDGVTEPDADPLDDSEVAADVADAVARGDLRARSDDAWGNAGIPGFGIGRPVRAPILDPAATPEPATGDAAPATGGAARAAPATAGRAPEAPRTGLLAPAADELVIASGRTPMAVFPGTPAETVAEETYRFMIGLAGAGLAVLGVAAIVVGLGAR